MIFYLIQNVGSQQTKAEIKNFEQTVGTDRNTRASIFGGLYLVMNDQIASINNLVKGLPVPELASGY